MKKTIIKGALVATLGVSSLVGGIAPTASAEVGGTVTKSSVQQDDKVGSVAVTASERKAYENSSEFGASGPLANTVLTGKNHFLRYVEYQAMQGKTKINVSAYEALAKTDKDEKYENISYSWADITPGYYQRSLEMDLREVGSLSGYLSSRSTTLKTVKGVKYLYLKPMVKYSQYKSYVKSKSANKNINVYVKWLKEAKTPQEQAKVYNKISKTLTSDMFLSTWKTDLGYAHTASSLKANGVIGWGNLMMVVSAKAGVQAVWSSPRYTGYVHFKGDNGKVYKVNAFSQVKGNWKK